MFIRAIALDLRAMVQEDEEAARRELLEQLVFQSLSSQEVFDEVVCFVMKQTNGNPDESSQELAFKLLFVLLMQRRPSMHLLRYVVNYVNLQLKQQGVVCGLAVAIMRVLLDDDFTHDDQAFNLDRFNTACAQLDSAPSLALATHLLDGASLEAILLTEKTAELLLRHGIPPPSNNSYGLDVSGRRDGVCV